MKELFTLNKLIFPLLRIRMRGVCLSFSVFCTISPSRRTSLSFSRGAGALRQKQKESAASFIPETGASCQCIYLTST
uniref:Uncharacterized protein n=1 Tax=Poecilia mexicana TaxID=48701 RepID=A0A3B3Y4I0_9TELE